MLATSQAAQLIEVRDEANKFENENKKVVTLLQRATEKISSMKEIQKQTEENFRAVLSEAKLYVFYIKHIIMMLVNF